jgi:hypothetical protein
MANTVQTEDEPREDEQREQAPEEAFDEASPRRIATSVPASFQSVDKRDAGLDPFNFLGF